MKIRAVTNGEVIELDEGTAKELIEAGIFEAVDEPTQSVARPHTKRRPRP